MSFKGTFASVGFAVALGVAGCGSVSLTPDGGGSKGDTSPPKTSGDGGAGGHAGTSGAGTAGATGGGGGGAAGAGTGGAGAGGHAGSTGGAGGGGCVCTADYAPVCGVDGVTYGNACAAACAGVAVAYTGACVVADAGSGDASTDAGKSDTITLRLVVPANKSYCDMTSGCSGPVHITIVDAAGATLDVSTPLCATICSTSCRPELCPAIACLAPHGVAFTGTELTWDGTIYDMSTCGSSTPCYAPKKAAAGRYVARMCATPGTVTTSDAGITGSTCTATGAEQCIDVAFDLPGPTPVQGKLP